MRIKGGWPRCPHNFMVIIMCGVAGGCIFRRCGVFHDCVNGFEKKNRFRSDSAAINLREGTSYAHPKSICYEVFSHLKVVCTQTCGFVFHRSNSRIIPEKDFVFFLLFGSNF